MKRIQLALGSVGALLAISAHGAAQSAGDLDPAFNGSGQVLANVQGRFYASAVQSDDKIIAVGFDSTSTRRWLVQRYDPDGTLDASFGSAGTVLLFGTTTADEATDVAIDGLGRAVISGTKAHGSHIDIAVVRLNSSNGSLDTSFGTGGVALVHAGHKTTSSSWGRAVAVLGNGKIAVAGVANGRRDVDVAVAQLTSAGALDTTFGAGTGKVLFDSGTNYDTVWYGALAAQADGKILVGWWSQLVNSTNTNWRITRFQTSGALDTSWGTGGHVNGSFPGTSNQLRGLTTLPDGRVVAGGWVRNDQGSNHYDGVAARYLSNGALDTSFNGTGYAITDTGQGVGGLAVQLDGSVLVGLTIGMQVFRFLGSGLPDASFGTNGLSAATTESFAMSISLDSLGHLVVAGGSSPSPGPALARFLGN